jgi:hypothetical protein
MATLEELTTEATAEIESAKPLFKQVNNERNKLIMKDLNLIVLIMNKL